MSNDSVNQQLAGSASRASLAVSSVEVASLPWAFTQHQPLGTAEFIKEAGCRGVRLDLLVLRELYRREILEPFVHVSNRRTGPVRVSVGAEPRRETRLQQLRSGRDRGRLSDPAAAAFRPRLRFDQADCGTAQGWWNGLLYSWYQLLVCPELDGVLARRKGWQTSRGAVIVRLPEPGPMLLDRAARLRTIAVVLTAAETRYLPVLDPDWLRLISPDQDDWQRYCYGFDPVTASAQLGYSADRARQDAEWLLLRARSLDPVGDSWSQLMRRAPARAWKDLKDAALSALDYRIAAEILLLFYQDLASRGQADPLPDWPRNGWHPLAERLSYRDQTLDEDLMRLGISPHPRVVLAVEGETEQVHLPLIWRQLGYPDAPELPRRTWSASCYEFAHFTDEELADGIMIAHTTIDGWTREELVTALGYWRGRGADIKRVWRSGRWDEQQQKMTGPWEHAVSKTKLAEALWPALRARIDRCSADAGAPIPEIVEVVRDAYHLAQRWRPTA